MKQWIGRHGGSILVVLLAVLAYFFSNVVVGLLEVQTAVVKVIAGAIDTMVPAAYGGAALKWIVKFHDAVVAGVEALAAAPKWFLPQAVTDLFPNGFGSGTVVAVKIVFGLALVYVEYRFFRLIYLVAKGCMWCINKMRAPFRRSGKVVKLHRTA